MSSGAQHYRMAEEILAQIVNAALGLGQDSGAHRPITALPVPEHSVPGHKTWL